MLNISRSPRLRAAWVSHAHVIFKLRSRLSFTSVAMESLKIQNSLKPGAPVPFIPIEPATVKWYACGPTVYDHSHLGHARNYVSTDIIRRILRDFFGFKVNFVMNITDIDDKIILKARRQCLLDVEKAKTLTESEVTQLGARAFQFYAQNNLPGLLNNGESGKQLSPENYAAMRDGVYGKVLAGGTMTGDGKPGDDEAKTKMHISNMTAAAEAIQKNQIFGGADEILLPYIDSLHKESIDSRDHAIFTSVTKYWENQFMEDMDMLNVLRPDLVTRVTDYVPQIVTFVEKIVEKGFAYESDGSIYFDIAAFEKAGNSYAHLRPDSKNDQALQADGEGSLSKGAGGKKGTGDFALWKKSKAGEPSWPSPWGEGRPGWHIECSVMASDILGSQMDIHSGGVDLAFPHHDNELAQSEAYYCENGHPHTWVNYFLHMGHLSIAGSKMSKSLKNFQTIRNALNTGYTARGMRIVFLMGRWNDGVEISPDMRTQADGWESTVNNFFTNVKSLITEATPTSQPTERLETLTINNSTSQIHQSLQKAQEDLATALADSFDTPRAMQVIYNLIREANIYINAHKSAAIDIRGLEAAARWVTKIVGTLGLDANATPPYGGLGWASSAANAALDPVVAVKPYADVYRNVWTLVRALDVHSDALDALTTTTTTTSDVDGEFAALVSAGVADPEALAMPYLRGVSRIRDELRRLAPSLSSSPLSSTSTSSAAATATTTAAGAPAQAQKAAVLALCDRVRDADLTNLGVYLDDRGEGRPSLIKFVPRAELLAQREEKAARERERAAQKAEAQRAREKAEEERRERARLRPQDMFKGGGGGAGGDERFGEWDAEGLPTKMRDGKEVPKSTAKKLRKDWERQKKLHDEYSKS